MEREELDKKDSLVNFEETVKFLFDIAIMSAWNCEELLLSNCRT